MIAWLVALLAPKLGEKVAGIVVWAVIVLVGVLLVATIWQKAIRGPYIEEGKRSRDSEVKAITLARDTALADAKQAHADVAAAVAANTSLQADLAGLKETVANQTDAITRYQTAIATARRQADAARAAADRAAASAASEIARLAALASGPAIADACRQASVLLDDLSDFARAQ